MIRVGLLGNNFTKILVKGACRRFLFIMTKFRVHQFFLVRDRMREKPEQTVLRIKLPIKLKKKVKKDYRYRICLNFFIYVESKSEVLAKS